MENLKRIIDTFILAKEDSMGRFSENSDWSALRFDWVKNISLIIVDSTGKNKKTLFLHHILVKNAFPFSF